MQKIRGAALLAATALAASGLAACGGEGEPAESSSTASPSAPETSSEASGSDTSGSSDGGGEGEVAELPAAAKKQTKEGAIAFNEFYWEARGEALKSGKTDVISAFSADACEPCSAYIDTTNENAKRGVTMNKNPNTVHVTNASKRVDSGYKVTVQIEADKYHEVKREGGVGRSADPLNMEIVTDTRWVGGHWVINDSVITKTEAPSGQS